VCQACEVINDLLDRTPRNVAHVQALLQAAHQARLQRLVDALGTGGDMRLQRLLAELLFRACPAVATPSPLREAAIDRLRTVSKDAASTFAAIKGADFEAGCRDVLVRLNTERARTTPPGADAAVSPMLVRSVQVDAIWYCSVPLGAPVVPRPAAATKAAPFWVDFNAHALSFEARLPGESDHDLVEVPYNKMTEFDFIAPPATPGTTGPWADGAGGDMRCLRLMLASPPALLRDDPTGQGKRLYACVTAVSGSFY
jgi:hypothetical protein